MEREIARQIHDLIAEFNVSPSSAPRVVNTLPPAPLIGFHQWADDKLLEGCFLIENQNGENLWILLIEWKGDANYYLVLFPESQSGPIAEIHESVDQLTLRWRYRPVKRDGRNEERRRYFETYFLSLDVLISIPADITEVGDFLLELLALAENCESASVLAADPPEIRDSFPEGKLAERLHRLRERNSALTREVKSETLSKHGKLQCQVCLFDFQEKYGGLGVGYIEAHHTKPVSELPENGGETLKKDIALVCSNCHRMLHRKRPWLEMDELAAIIDD